MRLIKEKPHPKFSEVRKKTAVDSNKLWIKDVFAAGLNASIYYSWIEKKDDCLIQPN